MPAWKHPWPRSYGESLGLFRVSPCFEGPTGMKTRRASQSPGIWTAGMWEPVEATEREAHYRPVRADAGPC